MRPRMALDEPVPRPPHAPRAFGKPLVRDPIRHSRLGWICRRGRSEATNATHTRGGTAAAALPLVASLAASPLREPRETATARPATRTSTPAAAANVAWVPEGVEMAPAASSR